MVIRTFILSAPPVRWVATIVGLILLVMSTNGFPDGAPVDACGDMMPVHGMATPQVNQNRLGIAMTTVVMTDEDDGDEEDGDATTVHVTLIGNQPFSGFFKGFMIQARHVGGDRPIGRFVRIPAGQQGLNCSGVENSAVTHTNNDQKFGVSFAWKPLKKDDTTNVIFVATIVKSYNRFWTNIISEVLFPSVPTTPSWRDNPDENNTSTEPIPTTNSTTNSTSLFQNVTTMSPLTDGSNVTTNLSPTTIAPVTDNSTTSPPSNTTTNDVTEYVSATTVSFNGSTVLSNVTISVTTTESSTDAVDTTTSAAANSTVDITTADIINITESTRYTTVNTTNISSNSSELNVTTEEPNVTTTLNPENVTTTLNLDNVTTTLNPDNLTSTSNPENVSTTLYSGNITTSDPENVTSTLNPDNATTTSNPENVTTTSKPINITTTSNPENVTTSNPKNATTLKPDNFITTLNPENVSTTLNPDNATTSNPKNVTTTLNPGNITTTLNLDNVTSTLNPGSVTTLSYSKNDTSTLNPDVTTSSYFSTVNVTVPMDNMTTTQEPVLSTTIMIPTTDQTTQMTTDFSNSTTAINNGTDTNVTSTTIAITSGNETTDENMTTSLPINTTSVPINTTSMSPTPDITVPTVTNDSFITTSGNQSMTTMQNVTVTETSTNSKETLPITTTNTTEPFTNVSLTTSSPVTNDSFAPTNSMPIVTNVTETVTEANTTIMLNLSTSESTSTSSPTTAEITSTNASSSDSTLTINSTETMTSDSSLIPSTSVSTSKTTIVTTLSMLTMMTTSGTPATAPETTQQTTIHTTATLPTTQQNTADTTTIMLTTGNAVTSATTTVDQPTDLVTTQDAVTSTGSTDDLQRSIIPGETSTSQSPIVENNNEVYVRFRITGIDFTSALTQPSSLKYTNLEAEVVSTLEQVYSSTNNFRSAGVTRFLKGSVIPEVRLEFTSSLDDDLKSNALGTLYNAVDESGGRLGNFSVDNVASIDENGYFQTVDACFILPCPSGAYCYVDPIDNQCWLTCDRNSGYCLNGGTCIPPDDGETIATCTCTNNYEGRRCEVAITTVAPTIDLQMRLVIILASICGIMALLFLILAIVLIWWCRRLKYTKRVIEEDPAQVAKWQNRARRSRARRDADSSGDETVDGLSNSGVAGMSYTLNRETQLPFRTEQGAKLPHNLVAIPDDIDTSSGSNFYFTDSDSDSEHFRPKIIEGGVSFPFFDGSGSIPDLLASAADYEMDVMQRMSSNKPLGTRGRSVSFSDIQQVISDDDRIGWENFTFGSEAADSNKNNNFQMRWDFQVGGKSDDADGKKDDGDDDDERNKGGGRGLLGETNA
ncbi:uncharacterized threonine-rich GPI-anchored glycoprotein PJ4664.02-like [Lytechinus variegatus]|uniref:uncharacterized threonine-rich GPI-anchored glycoprotein PJ4664.02-like n=1 Tax=Lytechinus variegatus TaxID=7654 RepID=UPI001BB2947D|nr:uncharacterized threonine-rich GPI-anchored glycoprotein PJ4664.02-like [Lytechinus variegatus]